MSVSSCTFHAAREALSHGFVELLRGHPATQLADTATHWCGHCVLLLLSDNHSLALDTGHIPGVGSGQPAAEEGEEEGADSEIFSLTLLCYKLFAFNLRR